MAKFIVLVHISLSLCIALSGFTGLVIVTPQYNDVIMRTVASQINSLTIAYSTVYSDEDQRKHQSSASPAFVWRIHRGPVNSPQKWSVTRKMFTFDDVIMYRRAIVCARNYSPISGMQCDEKTEIYREHNYFAEFVILEKWSKEECHMYRLYGELL